MGACMSVNVKFEDDDKVVSNTVFFEKPHIPYFPKTRLQEYCDDIALETLGKMPSAPVIRI
jgi:hypothetical protein